MPNILYIPYDIIYNIYFFINDYLTACNFWLLSKSFYTNYMTKYNATYKHKFYILYNDLYNFLSCLPTHNTPFLDNDFKFYLYIITSCIPPHDKSSLHKDAVFIYNLILQTKPPNTYTRPELQLHTLINLKFNKNKILK